MRKVTLQSLIVSLAALMAMAAGAAAPAPSSDAALARVLERHTTALARDRYGLAAGPLQGEAARGRPAERAVRLWAGQDYVFAAACDAGCGPLEVRIIAPNGAVLAQASGEAPVLAVRPAITGRHTLEAAAPSCHAQTCRFAVNVYAR